MISSSSHCFLINMDFSFLYMWTMHRNPAYCQNSLSLTSSSHTCTITYTGYEQRLSCETWISWTCAWAGATLATSTTIPAEGEPALGLVDLCSSIRNDTECQRQRGSQEFSQSHSFTFVSDLSCARCDHFCWSIFHGFIFFLIETVPHI